VPLGLSLSLLLAIDTTAGFLTLQFIPLAFISLFPGRFSNNPVTIYLLVPEHST